MYKETVHTPTLPVGAEFCVLGAFHENLKKPLAVGDDKN
jgi:hypothetical protein